MRIGGLFFAVFLESLSQLRLLLVDELIDQVRLRNEYAGSGRVEINFQTGGAMPHSGDSEPTGSNDFAPR